MSLKKENIKLALYDVVVTITLSIYKGRTYGYILNGSLQALKKKALI